MPVIQRKTPAHHPKHDKLVEELVRHLGSSDEALPEYPRIYLEQTSGTNLQAWVVWDDWDDVSEVERSQIILEAYATARGEIEALRLSLALGMTRREAKNTGIES